MQAEQHPTVRVAIVFGGRSSEHAISCVTAAGVLRAIDRTRYEVVPIGVTASGRWVLAPDDPDRWALSPGVLPQVKDGDGPRVLPPVEAGVRSWCVLPDGAPPYDLPAVDVVMPLLHGPFGEDGTVQGLLELADVPYVGSGVLASAASMDKHAMKIMLTASGLPVCPYEVVLPQQWAGDQDEALRRVLALGSTLFVKPARAGSSIGITRVSAADHDDDQAFRSAVRRAIEQAQAHDPKVLVEAAVQGREIECGVLADPAGGPVRSSVPGEIELLPGHDFYDFEAKYLDADAIRLSCPAQLDADTALRVQVLAARTFEAMACEGLARVDFFLTAQGELLVNELNTMPGFTPVSMYPRMWEASGVDYPELIDTLLQCALRRPVGLR